MKREERKVYNSLKKTVTGDTLYYVSIHAAESAYNHIKEELEKVVC